MREAGADDVERDIEQHIDGLRRLAERVAARLGGHPAVVRLRAVMDTYDRAGGGLVASGLAYTSLLALLPGFLLVLSVVGYVIRDTEVQKEIVAWVARSLPPLEDVARMALDAVSSSALPSGILAIVALLWGSSRFYANLDTAFSRIFSDAPRRNPVVQTIRGVILTVILVLVPVGLVTVGSVISWLGQFAPDGVNVGAFLSLVMGLASPIGLLLAFGVSVALAYRHVPNEHVSWRALSLPAVSIGLVLAVFTQLYAFIAPRLVGLWAVYGTALAAFGLLAWLSIAFNVLLVGAAWTEVRSRLGPHLELRGREPAAASASGTGDTAPSVETGGRD